MQAFTKLSGPILVLEQENIDTDQIIPARFLTATDFDGIGEHLFADWRLDADGEPVPGHRLNQPGARQSPILVGGGIILVVVHPVSMLRMLCLDLVSGW